MLVGLAMSIAMPVYGGWWTNYEGENWCHMVDENKYCLPDTFELNRIDDARLRFVARRSDSPSVFANYMGNDVLEEFLTGSMVPHRSSVKSDTYVNELRVVRRILSEADHSIMVVLIIFSDDSFVQMYGGETTQLESDITALMQPVGVR